MVCVLGVVVVEVVLMRVFYDEYVVVLWCYVLCLIGDVV